MKVSWKQLLLFVPLTIGLASPGSAQTMDETMDFIAAQFRNCSTLGHMDGPGGASLKINATVFFANIVPSDTSLYTEYVRVSQGESYQGNKFSSEFELKDLDPRAESGTEPKTGTEYIRFNCTRGACVKAHSSGALGERDSTLNAVTFIGCSGGQKDRLARALARAIELSGGKRSAF